LDDGSRGSGEELGTQRFVREWRGQDFKDFVPGGERAGDRGGRGGERGDAGDDLDAGFAPETGQQVHGRAVEQRVALTQPGDVAVAREVIEDQGRGAVIGCLRWTAL